MLRIFSGSHPGHNFYINVANFNAEKVKLVTYLLIFLGALYPAYLFRKLSSRSATFLEIAFILTAIPLLTPLAWKAYFIFLWPVYFILYYFFWEKNVAKDRGKSTIYKGLYWLSVILTVGSTEGIISDHYSDIWESYSVITLGSLILLFLIIVMYQIHNVEKSQS